MTLADAAREQLDRLRKVGGRRGRPYTADSLEQAAICARPWTGEPCKPRKRNGETILPPAPVDENGVPFAKTPVAQLRVRPLETYLERRAETTPRAAVGEYQFLVQTLKLAARRGEKFDQALLELEPVRRRPGPRRHRLSRDELRFAAARIPEHVRRGVLLGATLGGRTTETLSIEDGWLDLDRRILTVPDWATKERREKIVDLLPEEVALFREQRLVRSPNAALGANGTRLLFPRLGGTPYGRKGLWADLTRVVRVKAAGDWREAHGLPEGATTPFDRFTPYDLRRSAATLLREMSISPELAAARLGHKDAGHLLLTVYADARRERLKAELDEIAAEGGIDARLERRAGGATA
jgi:integrase